MRVLSSPQEHFPSAPSSSAREDARVRRRRRRFAQGRHAGTHTGNVESLSGLQCARARKNFFRGRDVPWLFTGTISVRSRFTGPTPVARFSIAVVISRKVSACRLREPEKKRSRRSRERETAPARTNSLLRAAIRSFAAEIRAASL